MTLVRKRNNDAHSAAKINLSSFFSFLRNEEKVTAFNGFSDDEWIDYKIRKSIAKPYG